MPLPRRVRSGKLARKQPISRAPVVVRDIQAITTARIFRIADDAEKLRKVSGLSVARAALTDIAKLNDLVVDKTGNRTVTHTVSDKLLSEEEWAKPFATDR